MINEGLMAYAVESVEGQIGKFLDRKMSKGLRAQVAGDIGVIAAAAFRAGYYAYAKECGIQLEKADFETAPAAGNYLVELIWRIQEAGRGEA